jgi:hypothetical protein
MRVKEVRISDHERFVVCHNPEAAKRDAAVRASLIAQLTETIAGSDKLTATKRAELRGVISTKPGLNRFLRVTPGGLLRTDARAIEAEAKLDGKYLLRCSDPDLSAEDIALGYKQLLEVERGWRDMKQVIDLRPVYHRKEERIRGPRAAVLAGPSAGPRRRDHLRRHLAQPSPRTGAPQDRYLRRSGRHLPPAHRDHHASARHPGQAAARRAAPDPRTHSGGRKLLTSANTRA